jgi:energy-coupling factor transporter ATP-binding protein EcfA2
MEENEIPQTNKIKRIDVDGLFGIHSYSIIFPSDATFSLLIGPNGIGKTTILQMVEFLADPYDADPRPIFRTQFRKLQLTYEDGRVLSAEKDGDSETVQPISFSFSRCDGSQESSLSCICHLRDFLRIKEGGPKTWSKGLSKFFGCFFSIFWENFPSEFLQGITPTTAPKLIEVYLFDHQTCRFFHANRFVDSVSLNQYFERSFLYTTHFSTSVYIPRYCRNSSLSLDGVSIRKKKDPLQEQMHSVFLLFRRKYMEFYEKYFCKGNRWPNSFYSQQNYDEIKGIFENGIPFINAIQFPHLFDWSPHERPLSDFHCFLRDPGVNSAEQDDAFGFNNLLIAIRSFSSALLDLKKNVAEMECGRLKKTLSFSPNGSFILNSFDGHSFGFEQLSTGEKNYLVLLMGLLLESSSNKTLMKQGSIYLVDEPEISMHIEMQRDFSRKLRKICAQTGCQIICATHSPFLADGDERLFADIEYRFPEP